MAAWAWCILGAQRSTTHRLYSGAENSKAQNGLGGANPVRGAAGV